MTLLRFGPKRLSPSLVVWQVRHALLNVSCPTRCRRPYAPVPGARLGTPEASGIKCRPIQRLRCGASVLLAIERAVAAIRSSDPGEAGPYRRGLRHQLNVLRRRAPRRPRLRWADRALFIWLYRRCPRILDAITIVRPETVLRVHRLGFAAYWRWKSRSLGGRPRIAKEVRDLIRRMSLENPF